MIYALGPSRERVLKHPDDSSSGASLAFGSSTISVNPYLQPQISNEYLQRQPPKLDSVPEADADAFSAGLNPDLNPGFSNLPSRASAEPPTDPSRENAMRSIGEEANVFETPAAPWTLPPSVTPLPLNSLDYTQYAGPLPVRNAASYQSWNGESEIDRLVREKLEGQHSFRAQTSKAAQKLADDHVSGFGHTMEMVVDSFWGALEGLKYAHETLIGGLQDFQPACKKMKQAIPIVVTIDEAEEAAQDGAAPMNLKDPGEEFSDMISRPSGTRDSEPVPDRIHNSAASATPEGTQGLSPDSWPESQPSHFSPPQEEEQQGERKPGRGRQPRDAASALSMSSAMTSSAAALLGGIKAKVTTSAREEDLTTGTSQPSRPLRPAGDSKTVLASSNMKSGAAASLGAFVSKPPASTAGEERPPASTAGEEQVGGRQESPSPKRSAQAKSVLAQSTVMKSSAAGALGGFVASGGRPAAPPDAGPELQASSKPKKAPVAKSVLAQSNVMSSSAAGALGNLVAQGGAKTAPRPEEASAEASDAHRSRPESPERSEPAAKTRRPDDKKSALAASAVMTSSAASTLGALSAAPKKDEGSADRSGSASTKPRPKGKANTVITGLNTSSSANALLGPMMQAKAKAQPK